MAFLARRTNFEQSMRKVLLTGLVIFILSASAIEAGACSVCGRDNLYLIPFFRSWLIVLVVWRMGYGSWQLITYPQKDINSAGRFLLTRGLVLSVSYFLAMEAGFIFYLLASYIKASKSLMRKIKCSTSNKNISRKFSAAQLIAGGFHLVALCLLIYFGMTGIMRFKDLDDLAKLRYVVSSGSSSPGRLLTVRIAKDPDFDAIKLKEMLLSSDESLQDKAYYVLYFRASFSDLEKLQEVVLSSPHLEDTLKNQYPGANLFLSQWLSSLQVPESIQTPDQLREWIAEQKKLREEEAANDGLQIPKTDG